MQKKEESGKKNVHKAPWKSPFPPQPCLPPRERAFMDLVCQHRLAFGFFPLSQRSRDLCAVQFPRFICSPEELIAGSIPKINTLGCAVCLMTFPHFGVIKSVCGRVFCLVLNSRYFGKFISTLRPPGCLPVSEEGGFGSRFSSPAPGLQISLPGLRAAPKFCLSESENPPWNERFSPGKPRIFLLPRERCSRPASLRGSGISQNPVPHRASQDGGGHQGSRTSWALSLWWLQWGHLGSRGGMFPVWDPGEGQQG